MQQIFRLLIFLIQPYMFRATNSSILRSTFWVYIQLLVPCTVTAADRCHGWAGNCIVTKAVYTVKRCSWGWANLSAEKCWSDLKILINEKVYWFVGCLRHWIVFYQCTLNKTGCPIPRMNYSYLEANLSRWYSWIKCFSWRLKIGGSWMNIED